jgi:putative ABC transport system permease protein
MFQLFGFQLSLPWLMVLRNLRARWVRTVLTAAGIVVGVAAMVAVNATNNSTLRSINRFFDEAAGQSDWVVETAASGERFDESILATVRRFPGVVAAAPGIVGITIPADEADGWEEQYGAGGFVVPGTNFWLMGRDLAADAAIHTYALVDGRLLNPNETAYSMMLVEDYAQEKGIEVGEDFAILTPISGVVALRVVGLIAKEGIGISNEGVVGIAPVPVVQALFGGSDQIGQIELVVEKSISGSTAELDQFRDDLAARLGPAFAVKRPASRGELVTNSLASYQQGLNFFSVVSLFVGSFLIYNAFAMTVVERTREIGMLRAVGTTQRQVIKIVLTEALLLGVAGSMVGVGFGLLLARGLVVTMGNFVGQTVPEVTSTPQSLLTSVVVGIVVTLAAAAVPALQAARISPLQALRVQGNVDERRWLTMGLKFGPLTVVAAILVLYYVPFRQSVAFYIGSSMIFVLLLGATLCIPVLANGLEWVIRPFTIFLFGNEGRLGSSNINRARGRTALTVAALMVGISMVVGINGLTNSFEQDIEQWLDSALGGDLFVRSPLPMRPDLEARLLALPEVTAVTPSRIVGSRLLTAAGDDEFALFVAIDPASYQSVRSLRIQQGPAVGEIMARLQQGGVVYVGADVANKFELAVGDTVTLETRRGRREFEIIAIVMELGAGETPSVTGALADMQRYFGVNDVSSFAVGLAAGAEVNAVADIIKNQVGRGQNLSVEGKEPFAAKIRALSAEAFSLFDVLGLIGLVVAALGVINTMLMNVLERTRELGGLRSLGMSRSQVRRMILAEATTMGFIGAIFGVGFGAVLSDVFIIGLRSIGGFVIESQLPVVPMIYSFFLAYLVALLAAWYPAVRASQVNIISAIKNE